MPRLLPRHRAHEYPVLMEAWHKVSSKAGLQATVLGQAGELPIIAFTTAACARGERPIYLSAGVHGDEVSGAWGLLQWAQDNVPLLRRDSFQICPCLNPHGFIRNERSDHRGLDLNRWFHKTGDPFIHAWQAFVKTAVPRLSLCLHEDYDGQGCYVYELSSSTRPLCRPVMAEVDLVLPREARRDIDGQAARQGIILRKTLPKGIPGPEAIVLHKLGSPITLTFETPSEFALDDRVAAHRAFIQAAIEHLAPSER